MAAVDIDDLAIPGEKVFMVFSIWLMNRVSSVRASFWRRAGDGFIYNTVPKIMQVLGKNGW